MSATNDVEMPTLATSQQPAAGVINDEIGTRPLAKTANPEVPQDDGDSQPKQKKSLAFKLSFVGLAAILFVFQVDATALGIALPVSNQLPSHLTTTSSCGVLTLQIVHSQ